KFPGWHTSSPILLTMKSSRLSILTGALMLVAAPLFAATPEAGSGFDWPQWRGPARDDLSKETGLLKQWPAEGPKKVWSFNKAGNGYGGISTAAGQLYTMGIRDGKKGLFSLDTATGKEAWATPMGDAFQGEKPSYEIGWG